MLVLQGDANLENLGSGGVTLTTTTAFTNYGDVWVDSFASFDGGSVVTFGGTLTNDGLLNIGITDLSASTTVNATTFVNTGTLDLEGNATSGTTDKASLVLSGAAVSTLTGTVDVTGDATLAIRQRQNNDNRIGSLVGSHRLGRTDPDRPRRELRAFRLDGQLRNPVASRRHRQRRGRRDFDHDNGVHQLWHGPH